MRLLHLPQETTLHRGGWNSILRSLSCKQDASSTSILLQDWPEGSWVWGQEPPIDVPFVMIVHMPILTHLSPVKSDWEIGTTVKLWQAKRFQQSLDNLVGVIAMADRLAGWWTAACTRLSVTCIKHPTETNVPQWNYSEFQKNPTLLQVGFNLRDTRAIYRVTPLQGWRYARIAPQHPHHQYRDATIHSAIKGECNNQVENWGRLSDELYDSFLARSVVLSVPYGVAACNTTVECIARGTPLVTPRSPEAEQYLGKDYVLYLGERPLTNENIRLASRQLIARRGCWLGIDVFADRVVEFCDQCQLSVPPRE